MIDDVRSSRCISGDYEFVEAHYVAGVLVPYDSRLGSRRVVKVSI